MSAGVGPRVSVVVPTYNRAESLSRLLDAIARSKMPDGGLEVVVVDDGSSDPTPEVAAQAGVRYLRQTNCGPAAARDRGWRAASGEVIVFFDDDVVPAPDTIYKLVKGVDSADACGAMIRPLNDTSMFAQYMHLDGMINHRVVDGQVVWLVLLATAVRREALERIGGFDLTFHPAGEDVDMTSRLSEAGCALRVDPTAVARTRCASSFWQLFRTLYVYGGGFRMLASRHTGFRRERTRSAFLRLHPTEWRNVYRHYRREASRRRTLFFLLLHAVVVLPYGLGVIVGQRAVGRPERARDVHVAVDGAQVELIGHRHETASVGTLVEETELAS